MSDDVELIRREIGEKMARDGQKLHDGASESARAGYRRGNMGFGSNVAPRNFGKTGEARPDWICVCGNINSGRVRYMVAKREVCGLCRLEREYVEDHDAAI